MHLRLHEKKKQWENLGFSKALVVSNEQQAIGNLAFFTLEQKSILE
jgi:hypothetical protein